MRRKKDYRFVLPEIKTKLIGTQGEKAQYMPYHNEEDMTVEKIREKLRRQPHMEKLADYISADRKYYLLEGDNMEQLQLAAAYIGTYHRIWDVSVGDEVTDVDGDFENWEDGDVNLREFDFNENMPYLSMDSLMEVYVPDDGPRFGSWMYREEKRANRPWWTMDACAPIIVTARGNLSLLPSAFRTMEERERIILLYYRRRNQGMPGCFSDDFLFEGAMDLESLSFELETDMLRLESPNDDSDYKKEILHQLAREKGEGMSSKTDTGKILSMIQKSRGNVENQTLSKTVSADEYDVQEAGNAGFASGIICSHSDLSIDPDDDIAQIRIAFDGDAVIFSDESERIFQTEGLQAFAEHEQKNAKNPLPEGPFAKLLKTISLIQQQFTEGEVPIRTALVTARNAPAHERVVRTLRAWDVRIDEAFFMGGLEKSEVLKAFGANIFFDDQPIHTERASKLVPAARVPWREK